MTNPNLRISFPTDAGEQERALNEHPYMAFARERRLEMEKDPYYPKYHYTAPEGVMNDPNGLCFWKGQWHLFYQAFPPEEPIHWGHAVSTDLLHWRDLPYAIHPDRETACWSGATLVEEDRVIAIYHGYEYGNIVAVSKDPLLLNWEKIGLIPHCPGAPYAVFDPCIWKEGNWYYALSGSASPLMEGERNVRTEYLFRSGDLREWEYLHPLVKGDFDCLPGDDGACPYFWPIGDKHLLLHFSHQSGGKYLIGRYDTEQQVFHGVRGGSFNSAGTACSSFGGVHAPSAAPDGNGGVVGVFNLTEAWAGGCCKQIVSLPRRFTLCGAYMDELAVEPAPELTALRGAHRHQDNILLPANQEIVLSGVRGNVMEVQMEFAPADTLPTVDVAVLRAENGEEATHIRCYRQRGCRNWDHFEECGSWEGTSFDTVVVLDNTDSSLLPGVRCRAPETAAFFLSPKEPLKLQIFLDKSLVEVFVNGRICLSARVYPSRVDSVGVSVRAKECETTMTRLDAWKYDGTDFAE